MAEGNETEVRTQGYEALFHPEIDKKYMCPVCLGAMRDAMQTSCGHRFCRSCVLRLVKYVLLYSPVCVPFNIAIFILRPKLKFYLFPLTRTTLKESPYSKNFISIFSQELFF